MSWAESREAGLEAGQGRGELMSYDRLTKSSPGLPVSISTQNSSAHVKERDQELWGTLDQDLSLIGFSKKTIKVFLIGLFKFARERLNVRRVWRVSGFFP